MFDRRLGRGPYLLSWAVLSALQVGPLLAGVDLDPAMMVGLMALLQLAKIPFAAMRMVDLGRQPDDAVFGTIIPFANLYVFFGILLGKTPKESRREKLVARWRGQPSWYAAAGPALTLMGRTAVPGLLGVLMLAIPQVLVLDRLEAGVPNWPVDWSADTLALRFNVAAAVAGFLLLYTGLQLAKRKTASPASWLPSIFALPAVLFAGALYLMGQAEFAGFAPVLVALVTFAFMLSWQAVMGGFVIMLWTVAADHAQRGEGGGLGAAIARVRERYLQVLPAHAGRIQLVWIGSQVVVPGLFYWVYAAFVVPAGVLEDEVSHPLTTRSGALTWGMMSRLVKLAVIYGLLILGSMSVVVLRHGQAVAMTTVMGDLSLVPLDTQVIVELLGTFALWWVSVVLMLLYKARVAQLDERRREREARKAAESEDEGAAAPPAEPSEAPVR